MSAATLQTWPDGLAHVAPGWQALVRAFVASPEGMRLNERLQQALRQGARIYPANPLRALQTLAPEAVRVVILGQDPYHGPGQANGLAFAVSPGVSPPPSLRNILTELARDYGCPLPRAEGLLDDWARQGVLLLNTSLTVTEGQAGSHAQWGWQSLTAQVFAQLVAQPRPLVFMLWGRHAQAMCPPEGQRGPHAWLLANHPSPLSARRPPQPFIGCGHFRQANVFLQAHGQLPIDWLGRER